MLEKQEQVLELIIQSLPYSDQIHGLDLSSEADAVLFSWRGYDFRVTKTLAVERIEAHAFVLDAMAILVRALIERQRIAVECKTQFVS